jgi:hypothetical protein
MAAPFPQRPGRSRAPRPSARQRALAQWRGLDLYPLERAQALHSQALADLMPGVVARLGLDRKRAEAEITRVWHHLIDPTLVAHARPTGLHKGTLFVTVDHSVWLDEIVRYRRREILERLQHSFGRDLIARISFRLG